jgi:hypothetical protein
MSYDDLGAPARADVAECLMVRLGLCRPGLDSACAGAPQRPARSTAEGRDLLHR